MNVGIYKCTKYNVDLVYDIFKKNIHRFIDVDKIFQPASKILIKPNLLSISNPKNNIVTHPIIIEALLKYLKKYNVQIGIGDNPGGPITNFKDLFFYSGITDLVNKYDLKLELFQNYPAKTFKFKDKKFYLSNVYLQL